MRIEERVEKVRCPDVFCSRVSQVLQMLSAAEFRFVPFVVFELTGLWKVCWVCEYSDLFAVSLFRCMMVPD